MPAPDTDNPYFVGPPPMTGSIAPDTDYPFFIGPPDFWFTVSAAEERTVGVLKYFGGMSDGYSSRGLVN